MRSRSGSLGYDQELKEIYEANHKDGQFLLEDPDAKAPMPTDGPAVGLAVNNDKEDRGP